MVRLSCIVEGHGERQAVPILLRRILAESERFFEPGYPRLLRVPKDSLKKAGGLERHFEAATDFATGSGGVVILLDADDDCPVALKAEFERRLGNTGLARVVAFAVREYESWFIAASESLRGQRGLPMDLQTHPDPEAVRGAKEWLARHMNSGYRETLDQAALSAQFDLDLAAARSPSFFRFRREIIRLATRLG